jgi:4-alpha-glucanotransferase
MSRSQAGILLHPTSLPGRFGIGDLGPEAERFLDWAASAGQSIWQVLPLGPTGLGNSPYLTLSAFAGNPLLISPERLQEDGLVDPGALKRAPRFPDGRVEFESVGEWKEELLRSAWHGLRSASPSLRDEHRAFAESAEQADWLPSWALFAALKREHRGEEWSRWEEPIRRRDPDALKAAAERLREEIEFQTFCQFLFARQWDRIRSAAHARGIEILGDAPIYVALDSADVWEHPDLFQLDDRLRPIAVSGVPPDYFSETGQLWGTPLYNWHRMETDGFAWWIRRLKTELRKVDLLRLDHFRGFLAFWSVPAGAPDARAGHWEPGPDIRLFRSLEGALGSLPLIAEDLGEITDDVRGLRDTLGLPGMRVLQFGLGHQESEHHPSRVPKRSVAYTGTHDNDTALGWFRSLGAEERKRVVADLRGSDGADPPEPHWEMIRVAYETRADRVVVPVQDLLGLGSEARMNTPAKAEGNWSFRAPPDPWSDERAERLRALASSSKRFGNES